MAYIFLSDGGPDAEDFDNNYFYYNDQDMRVFLAIQHIMANSDTTDPVVRAQIRTLCRESNEQQPLNSKTNSYMKWWKNISAGIKARALSNTVAG